MATAREIGMHVLVDVADEDVIDRAAQIETLGLGVWMQDPDCPGVVGLVRPGTLDAFCVVYVLDKDFELDGSFFAPLAA